MFLCSSSSSFSFFSFFSSSYSYSHSSSFPSSVALQGNRNTMTFKTKHGTQILFHSVFFFPLINFEQDIRCWRVLLLPMNTLSPESQATTLVLSSFITDTLYQSAAAWGISLTSRDCVMFLSFLSIEVLIKVSEGRWRRFYTFFLYLFDLFPCRVSHIN